MADALELAIGAPCDVMVSASGTPAFTTFQLDANNDAVEFIFQADEADTITHLGFRYGARTGTPPTYRISLQGVDASGFPDGTIKGGGSPASATFTPPASTAWDGTWQWVALSNAYTCTRGELLAMVIDYSSGTIDGSNRSSFTVLVTMFSDRTMFPYSIQNAATVRTKQQACPPFGYKSSTHIYGIPIETTVATTFTNGSTPDERGLFFEIPTDWCSTYKVVGMQWRGTSQSAAGTVLIQLLQTDGTVLQDVTMDSDQTAANAANSATHRARFNESSLATLTAGTRYYLTIAPQENVAVGIHFFGVDTADEWEPFPLSWRCGYVHRTNGASTTEDELQRPVINLVLAELTPPAGGTDPVGRLVMAGRGAPY